MYESGHAIIGCRAMKELAVSDPLISFKDTFYPYPTSALGFLASPQTALVLALLSFNTLLSVIMIGVTLPVLG